MTQADGMETQTETPKVEPAPVPGPLVRPQEGRWLAGVAAGTANRLGIPHWVARLLFFLAFASGGIGLFLYVVGWLLIPAEGEPDSLAQRLSRRVEGTQGWFGVGLVILAAAIVLNMMPFVDGGLFVPTLLLVVGILLYRNEMPRLFNGGGDAPTPPTSTDPGEGSGPPPAGTMVATPPRPARPQVPPSPLARLTIGFALLANGILLVVDRLSPLVDANGRHYFALALAALGAGLVVGAYWGRARWLIMVGLIMIPFMFGATVWEYADVRTNQTVAPTSFAESPLSVDQSSGQLTIDLTQLPWNGETFEVNASVGAGEIEIMLPGTVGVDLNGEIGIGSIGGIFSSGGFGIDHRYTTEEGVDGTLLADLDVGVGAINVYQDHEIGALFPSDSGDLFIDVSDESQLSDSYSTPDGAINLDLSELELTGDRSIHVEALGGPINIVLPEGISYRIRAHSDSGSIDLLGEVQRAGGGTVRADNISPGDVILDLEIYAIDGDITVRTEGQRS